MYAFVKIPRNIDDRVHPSTNLRSQRPFLPPVAPIPLHSSDALYSCPSSHPRLPSRPWGVDAPSPCVPFEAPYSFGTCRRLGSSDLLGACAMDPMKRTMNALFVMRIYIVHYN